MPAIPAITSTTTSSPGFSTTTTLPSPAEQTALIKASVADILGLTTTAAEDTANATASGIQAQGYQAELSAYNTVGAIAGQNATIAGIAGDIKALQTARSVQQTIGAQKAAVAAAGFGAAGSSLDLLRHSVQEGYLADQLVRTQSALTQGGYLEEGAASQAEAAGAQMASQAALALQASQAAAGQLAKANAANETTALTTYLAGLAPTPESALATGVLSLAPNASATTTTGTATAAPGSTANPAVANLIAARAARAASIAAMKPGSIEQRAALAQGGV